MKTCVQCRSSKPILKGFYTPYFGKCKACTKQNMALDRINNPEKYAERDRKRYHNNPRRKTQCNRAAMKASKEYPLHKKARSLAANAVRDGRLHKQPCEICGKEKVEAHHEDYHQPLVVRWLCRKHHMEQHRQYDLNQQLVDNQKEAAA